MSNRRWVVIQGRRCCLLLVTATASLLACNGPPPFVLLTIEDPTGAATQLDHLAIGVGSAASQLVKPKEGTITFPVTLTVVAKRAGDETLWVEARNTIGVAIARGQTAARFGRRGAPTATIQLRRACVGDGDCDDGLYCSGIETCDDGMCADGERPCVASHSCIVASICDEDADACSVTVDHRLCGTGEYCDASTGCESGQGCEADANCDDGSGCNGLELCVRGRCESGAPPCRSSIDCVQEECIELAYNETTCSVVVDHAQCGEGAYCNPAAGCVQGQGCHGDAECQDGASCNGEERCVNFVCTAGQPLPTDDASPCTLDGCSETLGVFHVPLVALDGGGCKLDEDADDDGELDDGICLASAGTPTGCVRSRCGDGFIDRGRDEECDDSNDDDSDLCLNACTTARCGDGVVLAGIEVCDDGNTQSGDGCRADCAKLEGCGDGIVDAGEQCDDGNGNPNDACAGCQQTAWWPEVVAGLRYFGGDPMRLQAFVSSMAADRAGNLYVADTAELAVWRVGLDGSATLLAGGGGVKAFDGDGGPATNAHFQELSAIATDGAGNVYIADKLSHRVRKICMDGARCTIGQIDTVAGNGVDVYSGDGGPATAASLRAPVGVAVDGLGNIYIADSADHRLRKVCGDGENCVVGTISTIAGNGTSGFDGDGNPASTAILKAPSHLAVDGVGNIYVWDYGNYRIRRICADSGRCAVGTIDTVAGNGASGCSQAGVAATATSLRVGSMAVDERDNLVIASSFCSAAYLLCFGDGSCTPGQVSAITGGSAVARDGIAAAHAYISPAPGSVAADARGSVYLGSRYAIWKICSGADGCPPGRIFKIALDPFPVAMVSRHLNDGAPATSGVSATSAMGVAAAASGDLFVVDHGTGQLWQVCGPASACVPGTIHRLEAGWMNYPAGIDLDDSGYAYVASTNSGFVSRICIDANRCELGDTIRFVGSTSTGSCGDDGPAASACLNHPWDVVVGGGGNVYIADTRNHRIRMVCVDGAGCVAGNITTVAGGGASTADGVATDVMLSSPMGLAAFENGDIYVVELGNRVRRLCVSGDGCTLGELDTVAGTGTAGSTGDGGPATQARLDNPHDVALDASGNLYISDTYNHRVRKVCVDGAACTVGTISPVAGTGQAGFAGDGGPATAAMLERPTGITMDANGDLYVAEGADWIGSRANRHVRKICLSGSGCVLGRIYTVSGTVDPDGDGELGASSLGAPHALAWLPDATTALVTDSVNGRVRRVDLATEWVDTVVGYFEGFVDGVDPWSSGRFSRLLARPFGIATCQGATATHVFVSEHDGHTVRRLTEVTGDWTVETYGGMLGTAGFADGTGSAARFSGPSGVVVDTQCSSLYVADSGNHVVRRVDLQTGETTTIAGVPRQRGFYGESVDARSALFSAPQGLALGPQDTLYIADTGNNRVRRVDLTSGLVTTVLGDGQPGSSGVGAPARYFPVDGPEGLAVDAHGNLYVSSRASIREVYAGADGIATGDDYLATIYGQMPRATFPESVTYCLGGLTLGPNGTGDTELWAVDACQGFLLRLRCGLREVCGDGIDNDGDTLVDCLDRDCFSSGCAESCDDGGDNDDDGAVDCLDPDCWSGCAEVACADGFDNDSDAATDCDDDDCWMSGYCPELICDDGVDNDADAYSDCSDEDCKASVFCPEVYCNDGVDDDGDGATDCEDENCMEVSPCGDALFACTDGSDNDGDGGTDCDDYDCLETAACGDAYSACSDFDDNDGDGLTDCDDPDCAC